MCWFLRCWLPHCTESARSYVVICVSVKSSVTRKWNWTGAAAHVLAGADGHRRRWGWSFELISYCCIAADPLSGHERARWKKRNILPRAPWDWCLGSGQRSKFWPSCCISERQTASGSEFCPNEHRNVFICWLSSKHDKTLAMVQLRFMFASDRFTRHRDFSCIRRPRHWSADRSPWALYRSACYAVHAKSACIAKKIVEPRYKCFKFWPWCLVCHSWQEPRMKRLQSRSLCDPMD